jgi:hypothetical protein
VPQPSFLAKGQRGFECIDERGCTLPGHPAGQTALSQSRPLAVLSAAGPCLYEGIAVAL